MVASFDVLLFPNCVSCDRCLHEDPVIGLSECHAELHDIPLFRHCKMLKGLDKISFTVIQGSRQIWGNGEVAFYPERVIPLVRGGTQSNVTFKCRCICEVVRE